MVERYLLTYAMLSYLQEKGMTQLDLYVPLVCKSIVTHNANVVSRKDLQDWFAADYGLSTIYKGVLDTLLKKMTGHYLTRENGKYLVVNSAVNTALESISNELNENSFSSLANRIKNYAESQYSSQFTEDDLLQGIMDFLHSRDGDMLVNQERLQGVLQKQKEGKTTHTKVKYIISRFILWAKDNDIDSFKLFAKLSMGHALSSIVSMKDVNAYVGKMQGVQVALDSPIVFTLMGLGEPSGRELAEELLSILKKQDVRFVVFRNHYQEVMQTISSARQLLISKKYNLNKASRLLKYSVRNKLTPDLLSLKLQQLDSVLSSKQIQVVSAPPAVNGYEEIDMNLLDELLVNRYTDNHPETIDPARKKIIENDVDVISYVYRIRGNDVASNLKNCKAFLVTTNTALAYASKHPNLSTVSHLIPTCMTDVFLSTILWFNYPEVDSSVKEKLLISDCYNNITLNDDILRRFYQDVEKLNNENQLTEEQVIEANTSNIVIELLENKTYNDLSLYTDVTTAEIIEELNRRRDSKINEKQKIIDKKEEKGRRVSRKIASVLFVVLWLVLVLLFLFFKFIDYSSWDPWLKGILGIISILPVLWGLLVWIGCVSPKSKLVDNMSRRIYKLLY